MAKGFVVIDGVHYSYPDSIADRVNEDGTLTCRDCGQHLPQNPDPNECRIGILWMHKGIRCRPTERDLST